MKICFIALGDGLWARGETLLDAIKKAGKLGCNKKKMCAYRVDGDDIARIDGTGFILYAHGAKATLVYKHGAEIKQSESLEYKSYGKGE